MMPTEAMLNSLQTATWRSKAYGNNPVGSSACEVVCYDVPGRESRGDRCRIRPPTHVTHDYPGGAAQPTVCELADNAVELAEKAAELRPMMASVTVSLVEAAALTTA